MFYCLARYKGDERWIRVTNFGEQFFAQKGILEYMIEKMQEKHPNIEYKIVEATKS